MKSQLLGPRTCDTEPLQHEARPESPGRPELCDLINEVVVRGEKKGHPLSNRVGRHATCATGVDIGQPVGKRERDLLYGGRSGLSDVIAADRDGVPQGQLARAIAEDVGGNP